MLLLLTNNLQFKLDKSICFWLSNKEEKNSKYFFKQRKKLRENGNIYVKPVL